MTNSVSQRVVAIFICSTLVLGLIIGVRSCSKASTKKAIQSVLIQDHEAWEDCYSSRGYSDKQSKIIPRGCPEDFKQAYVEHQKAWKQKAIADGGFFNGGERRKASMDIGTTWLEVLRIAEKYGVDTSNYR